MRKCIFLLVLVMVFVLQTILKKNNQNIFSNYAKSKKTSLLLFTRFCSNYIFLTRPSPNFTMAELPLSAVCGVDFSIVVFYFF